MGITKMRRKKNGRKQKIMMSLNLLKGLPLFFLGNS